MKTRKTLFASLGLVFLLGISMATVKLSGQTLLQSEPGTSFKVKCEADCKAEGSCAIKYRGKLCTLEKRYVLTSEGKKNHLAY